ncbi:hypothetical protein BDW22DRAFT_1360573 [Trametopsis cervina]|nr:hypothetical protein BDW22DRAFT_1360573 [Trametopsis cervina]
MSSSTRYSRSNSPTRSTAYTGTTFNPPQLANVVKKLAIEGKAERGPDGKGDGAAVKMYLRIALPLNSIVPGSTIPLFKEENLKILDSQVHPLDTNSVPYNFSSSTSPLLRKAGRALNLPARLRDSYMSLFGSSASSSSSSSSAAPLDDRYTGHILVSGYHVSYVLPKELPPRSGSSGSIGRRATSPEIQFMAAIDMWAPFLTKPPYSPYLLSLPVPRCLSNHIRLRIFPPQATSMSSSLASLSSAEGEATTWDLTSDPHVTRSASKRLSRSSSYQNFADEDTSDSSTAGFSDGYGIQGSFPSTDRMRVRWAAPMKSSDVPETSDGRRRVGIREVKSDLTCTVLDTVRSKGKDRGRDDDDDEDNSEGVAMRLEYSAICKGVWFPGVATMLGMDVSLDVGDSEVTWAPDEPSKWSVTGGAGFTGFAVGPPSRTPVSAQSSADAPSIYVLPSTPNGHLEDRKTNGHAIHTSTSSASLLRAPLPSSQSIDDSFESSPATTPLSSIASLATISSSPERRRSRASSVGARTDTDAEAPEPVRHPKVPISIHLNMNELLPPQKGIFTFSVSGTVVVVPRNNPFLLSRASSEGSSVGSMDPLPLPQLRVLSAEREMMTSVLRNEMDDSALDIYNSKGKISDPQARRTVLQPGGQTKCGSDGARLVVRSLTSPSSFAYRSRQDDSVDNSRRPPSRPRTPSNGLPRQMSSTALRQTFLMGTPKPKRDGPLMIPRVNAKITPLIPRGHSIPNEYAVRVSLPAPSDSDSEWLEFGLAQHPENVNDGEVTPKQRPSNGDAKGGSLPPQVQVASASYEGVPVRFETSTIVKPDSKLPALGLTFEETSTKEWMTWVRVHIGETGGGTMEVVYLVKTDQDTKKTAKRSKKHGAALTVLLPTFSLPVGVMEVFIETQTEFELTALQHNFTHQQTSAKGRTLTQYSLEEYFYPSLIVALTPASSPSGSSPFYIWGALAVVLCIMSTAMALHVMASNHTLQAELQQSQQALEACSKIPLDLPAVETETVTITSVTTIYATPTGAQHEPRHASGPSSQSQSETQVSSSRPAETLTTTSTTPSSTVLSTVTPTVPVPTTSSTPQSTEDALLPLGDMPFLLPIKFDFSAFEIPDTARDAAQVVLRGLGIAWQFCRKVYHYPLDPP